MTTDLKHLRPRFRKTAPLSIAEITGLLHEALKADDAPFTGRVLNEFVVLRILPRDQHYWSPELTLQLHKAEDGTLIRGLFGPRPAVWTMFAAFYVFALFLSLIALLFGLSQWSLDMTPYGLWLLPIPLGLVLIAYIISQVGQRLGRGQMEELYGFVGKVLQKGTAPP